MKFAILGAGAIGRLFAGLLDLEDHDVKLFTRREDASKDIERRGLWIETRDEATRIRVPSTTRLEALEDREVILFAVKSFDTLSIVRAIKPHVNSKAILVTVQNGLGNIEAIEYELPGFKLIGGSTTLGATLLGNGHVNWTAQGETIIGEPVRAQRQLTMGLARILTAAGIPTHTTANLRRVIWRKVLINVGINPVTALRRISNGEFADDRDAVRIAALAVNEGKQVSGAEGIRFRSDLVMEMLDVARRSSKNRSSMLQDVENHRKTEIDSLNGAIVRMGRKHAIPTPVNTSLWLSVKSLEPAEDRMQDVEVAA